MVDFVGLLAVLIAAIAAFYAYTHQSSTKGTGGGPAVGAGKSPQKSASDAPTSTTGSNDGTTATSDATAKKSAKKTPARASKPSKPNAHPRYVRRFGGHHGNILAMCPSPNGEWMATSGADGLLRVTRVAKDGGGSGSGSGSGGGGGGGSDVYLQAKIEDDDGVPDKACSLSWESDGRTVTCSLDRSQEIRCYRMRRKKDADASDPHPYELAELSKKRFTTSSKLGDVTMCVVDSSSSDFRLVLTSGDSLTHGGQKTTVAWDGQTGHALGEVMTGGGDVRLSDDGKFLCGRSAGKVDQVKLFEVLRKKVKGDVEPHFDRISPGKVMTLVAKFKVVDVTFGYNGEGVCDKAFVCGVDGTVQVWNLNVEYRSREDPRLLCSMKMGKNISMASSSKVGNRIAVVTADGTLHLLGFSSKPKPSLYEEAMIESYHSDGVGDVQFCPTGSRVYSRGAVSKDVFAWSTQMD